jgi:hypothetical protein
VDNNNNRRVRRSRHSRLDNSRWVVDNGFPFGLIGWLGRLGRVGSFAFGRSLPSLALPWISCSDMYYHESV